MDGHIHRLHTISFDNCIFKEDKDNANKNIETKKCTGHILHSYASLKGENFPFKQKSWLSTKNEFHKINREEKYAGKLKKDNKGSFSVHKRNIQRNNHEPTKRDLRPHVRSDLNKKNKEMRKAKQHPSLNKNVKVLYTSERLSTKPVLYKRPNQVESILLRYYLNTKSNKKYMEDCKQDTIKSWLCNNNKYRLVNVESPCCNFGDNALAFNHHYKVLHYPLSEDSCDPRNYGKKMESRGIYVNILSNRSCSCNHQYTAVTPSLYCKGGGDASVVPIQDLLSQPLSNDVKSGIIMPYVKNRSARWNYKTNINAQNPHWRRTTYLTCCIKETLKCIIFKTVLILLIPLIVIISFYCWIIDALVCQRIPLRTTNLVESHKSCQCLKMQKRCISCVTLKKMSRLRSIFKNYCNRVLVGNPTRRKKSEEVKVHLIYRRRKSLPNPRRKYTLYYTKVRGWLLKPANSQTRKFSRKKTQTPRFHHVKRRKYNNKTVLFKRKYNECKILPIESNSRFFEHHQNNKDQSHHVYVKCNCTDHKFYEKRVNIFNKLFCFCPKPNKGKIRVPLRSLPSSKSNKSKYCSTNTQNQRYNTTKTESSKLKRSILGRTDTNKTSLASERNTNKCNLFINTLRSRPLLKIYYCCPYFYPYVLLIRQLCRSLCNLLCCLLLGCISCPMYLFLYACFYLVCHCVDCFIIYTVKS